MQRKLVSALQSGIIGKRVLLLTLHRFYSSQSKGCYRCRGGNIA